MKKLKEVLFIILFTIVMLIVMETKSSAESDLYLNNLLFDVKVNEDASMSVTEYWDIEIEDTNTLYKSFKKDNSKYSGITDVKVTDITDNKNKVFTKQNNWQYHVEKGKFYGTENRDGDFEIGWGVGLDDGSDTREYKIEYKVENAITKYKDYSEMYWQLLGNTFEVDAKEIKGTITLPQNAETQENIKVWGHIETLNGTIFATDLNKIEFEINRYSSKKMLEVRILFPTEMITSAQRIRNYDILQSVIDEETKWAEEANQRRKDKELAATKVVVIIGLILDLIFIISIIRSNKNPIRKQEKIVADNDIEYYRDIPRDNATPGQALSLLRKNIYKTIPSDDLGKVFSAVLLNLKLKGYIDFEIDETKKKKEQISIRIVKATNAKELLAEEKDIYNFLEEATIEKEEKVLTLKELQKVIKSNPEKVLKLGQSIGESVHDEIIKEKLLDKQQVDHYTNESGFAVLHAILGITFALFSTIILFAEEIPFSPVIKAMLIVTSALAIIAVIKKAQIFSRANIYTQEGANEVEEWKGLKKYMEDFSLLNEKEVPDIVLWERFLVYATAFGIAEKVIKQLKLVYPDFDQLNTTDYALMYVMMNTDFSTSFSSSISSSISSTYSSGSGSGGGFSGGGGGGRWPEAAVADAK